MASIDPALQTYMEGALERPNAWDVSLAELRSGHEAQTAELWGRAPDAVAQVLDVTIDGPDGPLAARVYRPDTQGVLPAMVWYHGGGWVVGSVETHDRLCRALAARAPCCVIAVDYRLAPEHPFPAAVRDAWAGLAWTLAAADELRIDPARVAVGGDSAGGNLAAVTALRARDEGVALALQALVYPVTDADFESESYRTHGDGLNLTRDGMRWYWDAYLAGGDPAHPDASPLRAADLRGLAPALVQTAEYDVLRSEGEAYAQRLAQAGVATTLTRYDGMIHGFVQMPAYTPAATRALDEIATALAGAPAGAVR